VHPGRVKTGVAVQEVQGPVLRPGAQIALGVARGARDADGRELTIAEKKAWRVTEARRDGLDATQWRIEAPMAHDAPLVLRFPFPLDRALLARAFTVTRGEQPVPGSWSVDEQELAVAFRPDGPWSPGDYTVEVDPALEDPTGQRLGRAFERDVTSGAPSVASPAELRFIVP
jgi:hypothetical protein